MIINHPKLSLRMPLIFTIVVAFLAVLMTFIVIHIEKAGAVDANNFNPARIIDDSVFYNTTTMSANDVQDFLDTKVGSCDTQGTQPITQGSSETRAQYSATQGYSPPFTCLVNYSTNTNTIAADAYCNGYSAGAQTAAQIIYGVSQSCGINPQVLLVLLQKEEGLVTDTWPWSIQYQSATGYGCPDSSPGVCNANYYGFFNQVYLAAHQFKLYAAKPQSYSYIAGQTNSIAYMPNNSSCGTESVEIQNQATAGLYNYTPYVPDSAAISEVNGTGSGDGCSSYGNLNFWEYFNEWFGPTTTTTVPGCSAATNTTLSCVWKLKKVSDNSELLVTSYSDLINDLNSVGGYQYEGVAFYARNSVAPSTGNIPIYSLTVGDGTFITADQNEYQTLKSEGYQDNGILFYADPAGSNTGYPVVRLYSPTYGHVWTSNLSAVQTYIAQGYTNEGVAFTALSPISQATAPPTGEANVYRFNLGNLGHFWTTDINERDTMIQAGYDYEGASWLASANQTSVPIYRLYAPALREHLFTSDINERNVLSASGGWNYEGIAFYESPTPTNTPVYRLYSLYDYEHLLTTYSSERDILVGSGVYQNEGIAWYSY